MSVGFLHSDETSEWRFREMETAKYLDTYFISLPGELNKIAT